jgi:acyl carrier protein
MSYSEEIRAFVVANFLFGDGAGLVDDASFFDTGIVDSTGILELIMFLENRYGIKIGAEEMVPENLDSINRVVAFVTRKVSTRAEGSADKCSTPQSSGEI